MSWSAVVTLVISSSVISMLLGKIWDYLKERSSYKNRARFEALKIVFELEEYVIKCANIISNQTIYDGSKGALGEQVGGIPHLPKIELAETLSNYKNSFFTDQILQMYQIINHYQQEIEFIYEAVDLEVAQNTAKDRTAKIAQKCYHLSTEIRSTFKLPQRNLKFGDYDIIKVIEKKHSF